MVILIALEFIMAKEVLLKEEEVLTLKLKLKVKVFMSVFIIKIKYNIMYLFVRVCAYRL